MYIDKDKLMRGAFRLWSSAILFFFLAVDANAALTFTVEPYDGSPSLSFGTINPAALTDPSGLVNREVKVRITSDLTSPYRVFQRVYAPLANERGERLDEGVLTFYSLRGSNANGTVYADSPFPLSGADQLIYSSDMPGSGDSMIFVYTIDAKKLKAGGNFSGRFLYTLYSLNNDIKQEIYLDVFFETSGEFKIEAKASSLGNLIELSSKDESRSKAFAQISFNGNFAGRVDIYQYNELPVNEVGKPIDPETIKLYSDNPAVAAEFRAPQALERRRVLLYSSHAAEDKVIFNFVIDKENLARQTAGLYRGKIRYTIARGGREETADFDIQVAIAPIFTVEISMPPEGMRFENVLPDSPPQFREVLVTVESNMGKPYMVIQNSISPLANARGKMMGEQFFAMKGEILERGAGEVKFSDFTPVPIGASPVFFSDAQGSSVKFKIIYRVKVSSLVSAGDYQAVFDYSLSAR